MKMTITKGNDNDRQRRGGISVLLLTAMLVGSSGCPEAIEPGTTCGDGVIDAGEACDDGSANADDAACKTDCTAATCGDGSIWAGTEACDDGNASDGDYCSADCEAVTGRCGDGVVQTNEACDDGTANADDAACKTDCSVATCGDGFIWADHEACDDGNGVLTDDCPDGPTGSCEPATCGDGFIWADHEACDDGNSDENDACLNTCASATCGDGVVRRFVEACDDGNSDDSDDCSNSCRWPGCGDGTPSGDEACDDGNTDNTDDCLFSCLLPVCGDGFIHAGVETCDDGDGVLTDGCPDGVEGSCVSAACGDGYVWAGNEECDNGVANADNDACKSDCTAATCGDGFIWVGNEECDDGNDRDGDGCSADCTIEVPALSAAGLTGSVRWADVLVSPNDDATLYAIDTEGMVHRSHDAGVSWRRMCRNPGFRGPDRSMLIASKGVDRSVYVTSGGAVFRVAALDGADCAIVTSTLGAVCGFSSTSCFAPTHDGERLYAWLTTSTEGTLWESEYFGTSWTGLENDLPGAVAIGLITVDPSDPDNILVLLFSYAGGQPGLYRTTDGHSYTLVSSSIAFADVRVAFDPAHPGWVYASNGFYSQDSGETWKSDNRYSMSTDWETDDAGAGYQAVDAGGSTALRIAADMRNPSWEAASTVPAAGGTLHVSVGGTTVAMVAGERIWVSTDAGTSFEQAAPVPATAPELSSIDAHDGQRIYATTANWTVFKSADSGTTWQVAYVPAMDMPLGNARVHTGPIVGANENVIVFSDDPSGSTYESALIVSRDGMQTATESTDAVNSWAAVTAISRTNAKVAYQFGRESQVTWDSGDTWTPITPNPFTNVWHPAEAWVHWSDPDIVWVVEQGGQLWEFDATTNSRTDIAANAAAELDNDPIAGLDVVDEGLGWSLRVISRTGNLAISSDGGISFVAEGTAPGLNRCSRRRMASVPGSPGLLATACVGSSAGAAYSTDSGVTWTDMDEVSEWANASCVVRDVVMTSTVVLFACHGQSPRWIAHTVPPCGDGVAILPEQCDDGPDNSDTLPDACRTNCRAPRCGDNVVDAGETCDDGNLIDGDGCDSNCTATACGNGVRTSGEECDDGPGNADATANACGTDCTSPVCGDGRPDPEYGEGCDDGASNSDTTPDACRSDCSPPRCGDNVVDAGEECDDGNVQQGDSCTPICRTDVANESGCDLADDDGDGIVDEGCGGTVPSNLSTWQAYDFSYAPNNIECSGARYIKTTGYAVGAYVGVILCSAARYKILLADDPAGPYYSAGDWSGSGEDHCEFVGAADQSGAVVHAWANTDTGPGYRRDAWGVEPQFGTIGGATYSGASYECGVSIP